MDSVQAEANTLFSMLAAAERLIVLFDEFDEMVRERTLPNSDATSRFLTTAMLPKLSLINRRRRIVFILATNYIDQFDFAIARPGRFDRRFQIMPPTMKAKLGSIPEVEEKLKTLGLLRQEEPSYKVLSERLEALTYDEFKAVAKRVLKAEDQQQVLSIVEQEFKRSTLQQSPRNSSQKDTETWQKRCVEQRRYIR
jgi:SpoVK/Ycf46/Vps4 family AAA+-type ATPase